eukprot:8845118-Alexandrium_andersonii.AAC.1
MSASLVGSEMCIRDSARTDPRDPAHSGWSTPTGGRARYGRANAAPVSYTHLTLPTICSVDL